MVDFTQYFSTQDETGTVYQFTVDVAGASPALARPIAVGDQGMATGTPDDGTSLTFQPGSEVVPFTVSQVLNPSQFSVTTTLSVSSDWPASGTIMFTSGPNNGLTVGLDQIDGANAYIDETYLKKYFLARGVDIMTVPVASPDPTPLHMAAIVKATDYLDQKYRYNGIKLLQRFGTSIIDANAVFLESWLTPYALNGLNYLTPSVTNQATEWPRQGVIDFNGNTINGIPPQIKQACAELAFRVLNGTNLQPDYDPTVVANGGVVAEVLKKVGPLETLTRYDTKIGLGFFASFPQIDRMLSKGGLLNSGGGRTVIR
jgi:hypothetical protein